MKHDYNITRDMLILAGHRVTLREMKKWSTKRLEEIENWAACIHSVASDNGGTVPKKPRFKSKFLTKSGFIKQLKLL